MPGRGRGCEWAWEHLFLWSVLSWRCDQNGDGGSSDHVRATGGQRPQQSCVEKWPGTAHLVSWSQEPSGSSLVMLVPLGFSLIQEKIIDLLSC